MTMKRVLRWGIVLFLLAALPGLTAVMAQGEQPAEQPPVVLEPGEAAVFIPWSNTETEPNNTFATHDEISPWGRVAGGIINKVGDVDYFKIYADFGYTTYDSNIPLLIDIEAQSMNSPLDAVACLYSWDFIELTCSNNTDTLDPMLYFNLEQNDDRPYYLSVRTMNSGGSAYKYQILLSYPLLISAAAGGLGTGYVAGIPFQSGDILAWSKYEVGGGTYEKWVMFLDLSDLNVKGNLTNLAAGWRNSDTLLLGFATNVTLPGISGPVTPWEVVAFNPTSIGPNTAGTFERWWSGGDHGLMTTAEKIDAIDWPTWSGMTRLYVSTMGKAIVPGGSGTNVRLPDEDIGLWTIQGGGNPQKWEMFGDGSLTPGLAVEDVIAASHMNAVDTVDLTWTDYYDYQYMVIQGTARCGTPTLTTLTQKDIFTNGTIKDFIDDPEVLSCHLAWHGPDHGWNYNIDAIDWFPTLGHGYW